MEENKFFNKFSQIINTFTIQIEILTLNNYLKLQIILATMHARVVEVEVKQGTVDEVVTIYEKSVVPAVKLVDGYLGGYLLVDRDNNKALSIALFESLEKINSSAESGHLQEQFAKFSSVLVVPPVTTVYEVTTEVERYSVPSSYH